MYFEDAQVGSGREGRPAVCDANVSRTVQSKANTRARLLNPDRLQDQKYFYVTLMDLFTAFNYMCGFLRNKTFRRNKSHLHCNKHPLPAVQCGQSVGGANHWLLIQPNSQEVRLPGHGTPSGCGTVLKALIDSHHWKMTL